MPNLPTLTVTQAQLDRLIAVFGDATQYKAWLRTQLVRAVLEHEAEQIREKAQQDVETRRAEVAQDIGNVPLA